jgi:hypothetical protein
MRSLANRGELQPRGSSSLTGFLLLVGTCAAPRGLQDRSAGRSAAYDCFTATRPTDLDHVKYHKQENDRERHT